MVELRLKTELLCRWLNIALEVQEEPQWAWQDEWGLFNLVSWSFRNRRGQYTYTRPELPSGIDEKFLEEEKAERLGKITPRNTFRTFYLYFIKNELHFLSRFLTGHCSLRYIMWMGLSDTKVEQTPIMFGSQKDTTVMTFFKHLKL